MLSSAQRFDEINESTVTKAKAMPLLRLNSSKSTSSQSQSQRMPTARETCATPVPNGSLKAARVKDLLSTDDWLAKRSNKSSSSRASKRLRAAKDSAASGQPGLAKDLLDTDSETQQLLISQFEMKMQEVECIIQRRSEILAVLRRPGGDSMYSPHEIRDVQELFETLGPIFEDVLPYPLGNIQDAPGIGETCFEVEHPAELEFIERFFILGHDGTECSEENIHSMESDSSLGKKKLKTLSGAAFESQSRLLSTSTVAPRLPNFSRAIKYYIYFLVEIGRFKDALKAIDVALKRQPTSTYALFERMEILKQAWLRRQAKLKKSNEDPHSNSNSSDDEDDDPLNDQSPANLLLPGDLLDLMYTETQQAINLSKTPKDMAKAYRNAAFYQIEGGHYDAALALCLASLRYEQNNQAVMSILVFSIQKLQEQHDVFRKKQHKRQQAEAEKSKQLNEDNMSDDEYPEPAGFQIRMSLPDIRNVQGFRSNMPARSTSSAAVQQPPISMVSRHSLPGVFHMPAIVTQQVVHLVQRYLAIKNTKGQRSQATSTIIVRPQDSMQRARSEQILSGSQSPPRTAQPNAAALSKSFSLPRLFNAGTQKSSDQEKQSTASSDTSENASALQVLDEASLPANDQQLLARLSSILQRSQQLNMWIDQTLHLYGLGTEYNPLWASCYESTALRFEQQGKNTDAINTYQYILGLSQLSSSQISAEMPVHGQNALCTHWSQRKKNAALKRIKQLKDKTGGLKSFLR